MPAYVPEKEVAERLARARTRGLPIMSTTRRNMSEGREHSLYDGQDGSLNGIASNFRRRTGAGTSASVNP